MLPELREDLFGKNDNRKFYTVSEELRHRSVLTQLSVSERLLTTEFAGQSYKHGHRAEHMHQ